MAERTLESLQEIPESITALPGSPPKKKRTRNRGANKIITQRPSGKGKRLVPTEKAMILAEKGLGKTTREVGEEYGVSHATVIGIWRNPKLNALRSKVDHVKKDMAAKMYLTADLSIEQVADKIQDASARDAAIIAGVMIDKARLIEGESTSNQSVHVWLSAINGVGVKSDKPPVSKAQ